MLEYPIKADFALIKAHQGDRWGNLVYRKAARNFGPIMATAAKTTIVEVSQLVALGDLDPEKHHHPRHFRPARLLAGKPDCRTTRLRSPTCKN
ncbi:3-oxoadipate CoA-transferase subunit A [Klebsiella aerogenes]|nr:3-oxoadipate CoA-transferase subunit A [Klebsiella aerogenes]